jgi:hypothetical protein
MSLLTTYHPVLRAVLGDRDPDVHMYDGDQLSDAMTAVVNVGKVPGYAITQDGTGITPDLTPASDQPSYALLVYHTAKMFVVTLTATSYRTRAFSESFGDSKEFIVDILQEVYRLENGDQSSD